MGVYLDLGSLAISNLAKTALAASKLKLVQTNGVIARNVSKATLDANEADFSGYTEQTVAALLSPYLPGGGGAAMIMPTEEFAFDSSAGAVTNIVYGWWLETGAGIPWYAGQFESPIAMQADGDAIPMSVNIPLGGTEDVRAHVG